MKTKTRGKRGIIGKFANWVSLPPKVIFELDPVSNMPADIPLAELTRTIVFSPQQHKTAVRCTEIQYTKEEIEHLSDFNDILLSEDGSTNMVPNTYNNRVLEAYETMESMYDYNVPLKN